MQDDIGTKIRFIMSLQMPGVAKGISSNQFSSLSLICGSSSNLGVNSKSAISESRDQWMSVL